MEKEADIIRPPIPVIALGLIQAVIGGVASVILILLCVLMGKFIYEICVIERVPLLPEYKWYAASVWPASLLAICAFFAGRWLLSGNPLGRRFTLVLAYAGIPYSVCQLCALILLPPLEAPWAANPHYFYYHNVGFIAYCLIAIAVMHLPSVRRVYRKDGEEAGHK